jgi:hypothetical protein
MKMRALMSAMLAIVAGSIAPPGALARPIALLDIPTLVQNADVIVIGRVKETHFAAAAKVPEQSFSIAVDRVLKAGKSVPPGWLSVRLGLTGVDDVLVADEQYGVFFLKSGPTGSIWMVLDSQHPALAAVPQDRSPARPSNDPLAAVAGEFASVLATPAETLIDRPGGKGFAKRVEISTQPFSPKPGAADQVLDGDLLHAQIILKTAVDGLSTIPYPIVREPLGALATSDQLLTKLWANSSLVGHGDARFLAGVKSVLLDPPAGLDYTIAAFAAAMEAGSRSPAGSKKAGLRSPDLIPLLGDLLNSRSVVVRRAAAYVLRDIGTSDAVPPLASIALADKDQEVRYYAVGGLYKAARAGGAPSAALFKQQEQHFLQVAARLQP